MLVAKKSIKSRKLLLIVLLLFNSVVTFHTNVSADIKDESAEGYRELGFQEQREGNLRAAITYYSKAIALGLNTPGIYNDLGVAIEQLGRLTEAEQYYLRALALDRDYLPTYTNLAYLYKELGEVDQAIRFFELRFERGDPADPWTKEAKQELIKLKPGFKGEVEQEEAKALNEQLVNQAHQEFNKQIQDAQNISRAGEDFLAQGQYRLALAEVNRALRITPNNPKILEAREKAMRGLTKERMQQKTGEALKMLDAGDTNSARMEIQKLLSG